MSAEVEQGTEAKQAYFANEGKNAEDIDVTLFREIIFVPLTIDPVNADDPGLMAGRTRMCAAIEILEKSTSWKRRHDRLRHLPGDNIEGDIETLAELKRRRERYEEFVYFEPYVQRFLYGDTRRSGNKSNTGPIALFYRDEPTRIEATYKWHEESPEEPSSTSEIQSSARILRRYRFRVERCNLYLYETGNAILALEIRLETVETLGSGAVLPDSLKGDPSRMTLADCQIIIENMRRVFPPFFTEVDGRVGAADAELEPFYFAQEYAWPGSEHDKDLRKGIRVDPKEQINQVVDDPSRRAPPMFEPWRKMLEPIQVEGAEQPTDHIVRFGQTGDDRGHVMAQIGTPNVFDIRRSDWVRLCFCDAPYSGYPYAQAFLENFEEEYCYDRFFDAARQEVTKNTRYLVCPYAFIMVGNCEVTDKDWFLHLFSRHFRRNAYPFASGLISML